jgi:ribosomal protein S18 acetylase RimI-like enzyme
MKVFNTEREEHAPDHRPKSSNVLPPRMDGSVRDATAADIAGIQRVAERAWRSDYALTRETAEAAVRDWYGGERMRAEVDSDDSPVVVADDDGVVGFAHGVISPTEGFGTVLRLYVDPDRRREGLGRALLEAIEARLAEDCHRLQATVLSANEAGRAFYRAAGYEETGESETTIGGEQYPEVMLERAAP